MIPLSLPVEAEMAAPYVTRLRSRGAIDGPHDTALIDHDDAGVTFSGAHGLIALDGMTPSELDGDVLLIDPLRRRADRLIRADSAHNTLLVTERCDQLCVMCSQPPRKTHVDRFALLTQACLLAPPNLVIGITGGEPTLYKHELFALVEQVLTIRPDLEFHILTNAQHFDQDDISRLRQPLYHNVTWGIPLYASDAALHDEIVGKHGAFDRLGASLAHLLHAGARVELRTVLLRANLVHLPALARYVGARLRFIHAWSIMQLEKIGFARRRWDALRVDHAGDFSTLAAALDQALLDDVPVRLFNFPLCTVPEAYRALAMPSISDWKRKYAPPCDECRERARCSGFFEWHPDEEALASARPL